MGKPPSWNDIRKSASEFAERWADETDENAGAQSFWIEFLGMFGIDRRRVATFEARAARTSTGGKGRIDLFWPGVLIVEHKSAGKSLVEAERQAIDYLDSIDQKDFPGVVVCSNFERVRIRDLGGDNLSYEFPLTDLVREIDRFGFIAGYKSRQFSAQQEEQASIQAAQLMGRLYEELARGGYEGHDASVLMTRLLFILFSDDTGMWEKSLFEEFIQTRTQADGSDLGAQLAMLFQVLDRPSERRTTGTDDLLLRFPYVNGGLFADRIDIPTFDRNMRDELLRCCSFDWSRVSPDIFGSLFQAIKSKEARRELGEHYTTPKNIRRLLDPILLDGLREEFKSAYDNPKRLSALRTTLSKIRVMDPACGCGNFLVVAYRELRRLELDIMERMRDITNLDPLPTDPTHALVVKLSSFYGIEIEEWPAKIAQTAMFLADHQANLELAARFGRTADRLPLTEAPNILHANALTVDWSGILTPSEHVYIVGNPPFIGSRLENAEQKQDQARVWAGNKRQGTMDFVTNWFALAARWAKGTDAQIAFVATNSITQGEQPAVLWRELRLNGMSVDFAHRTFAWSSEAPGAAHVHCVIVGFSGRKTRPARTLWVYDDLNGEGVPQAVKSITPYLTAGDDIVIESRQQPIVAGVPRMLFGSMPRDAGHLSKISGETAAEIRRTDPVAAKYLRRLIGAEELINGGDRWCLWLVDALPNEIAGSPVLRHRLAAVKLMRESSEAASTKAAASTPGLFVQRAQPGERYLAIPAHSSEGRRYLPTAFFDADVIALNALLTISGADEVLFGILSSSVFTAWSRTVSGRLKSDIRVSQEITYNNFPWLAAEHPARAKIAAAAREVLDARLQFSASTLGDLYNPLSMPLALVTAHKALDQAVLAAYKIPAAASEPEILAILLRRYAELASQGQMFTAPSKRARRVPKQ